jgi:hypothetical protein
MNDEADEDILGSFRSNPTELGRDAGSAPAMLRLKLLKPGGKPKPRERWALPYTLLKRAELENPGKLILVYAGATVTIEGPRMGELFDQIAQHKIALIEVQNQSTKLKGERTLTSVDSVEIDVKAD